MYRTVSTSVLSVFVGALPLSVFPYCPPVCMPAAGCQPIRPPGQFFQPLTLLQCHQHRQGSSRGHQLLQLLWNIRPQGGQHFDTLLVCRHLTGNSPDSCSNIATCWGTTAIAASHHFTYRWVVGLWKSVEGGKYDDIQYNWTKCTLYNYHTLFILIEHVFG